MGLDANFWSTTDNITFHNDPKRKKIKYYRGHWQLQIYLSKLYKERGGRGDFSCANLELTKDDLELLLDLVTNFGLPKYGDINYDIYFTEEEYGKVDPRRLEYMRKREKECWHEDIETINLCLKEIENGNKIFYSSWW